MTDKEVKELANLMLKQSGLADKGWRFYINMNRSRLGVCNYRKQHIEISAYHLTSEPAEIRNTLLHEIAHALVGPYVQAHGREWRQKALEIGCNGQRCGKMDAPSKYIGTCPKCNTTVKRNRMTQGLRAATHVTCGASRARGEYIRWEKVG